jgi:hypothetical protein
VDYSVALKFVPVNLKYSGVLLESYFSISHIAHRVCLDYILINLYPLYFAVGGGHFADRVVVRQTFPVVIHQYGFAFLLYYLTFYLLDFEHWSAIDKGQQ